MILTIDRKTYPDENDEQQEEVRHGFDPDEPTGGDDQNMHNLDTPFAVGEDDEEAIEDESSDELGQDKPWESRNYSDKGKSNAKPSYGSFNDERNVWGHDDGRKEQP